MENYIDVINKEVSTPGVNGHIREPVSQNVPPVVASRGVSQDSHKSLSCMAFDVCPSS